jgi:hypothetical protein
MRSLILIVFAGVLSVGTVVSAQAPRKEWTPPRTPWGDPDLQGLWPGTQMMGVPLERPAAQAGRTLLTDDELQQREAQARRQAEADNEEFVAPRQEAAIPGAGTGPPGHWGERGIPQRQTALVVDPADGRIPPMRPEARQRVAALPHNFFYDNSGQGPFDSPNDLSIYDRCITRGVVGSTRSATTRATRSCRRPETGVTGNGRANYTTDAVRLVERFTRVDRDTLQYQVTIEDPRTWTRPWSIAFPLKRDPRYGMFEYACHEGNNAMRNILSGARADERRQQ